ncbi:unnamed protein product [Mytilus edulis]|uniref:IRG-type G domain-containing protein n=1 Tax=Mytilus edulis TaxID=6550 RepID=A0A8S3R8Z0_MYTED|nr:unnamed protein product [Mytilus edulis]
MQVESSTMNGGSHASWIFDDGWWITCRLESSMMNGGSHAGWIFDDGWWITCKLDLRRWMVDHMQVGVFDDEWWITCKLDFRRWMVDHMQNVISGQSNAYVGHMKSGYNKGSQSGSFMIPISNKSYPIRAEKENNFVVRLVSPSEQIVNQAKEEIKIDDESINKTDRKRKYHHSPQSRGAQPSELQIFEIPPYQVGVESITYEECRPVSQITAYNPIEFDLCANNGMDYIDLKRSKLYVKLKVKKANGEDLQDGDTVGPVNLFLQSLWSQLDVYIQGQMVTSSNTYYPYKSPLSLHALCVLKNESREEMNISESKDDETLNDKWFLNEELDTTRAVEVSTTSSVTNRCINCEQNINSNQLFCDKCGFKLGSVCTGERNVSHNLWWKTKKEPVVKLVAETYSREQAKEALTSTDGNKNQLGDSLQNHPVDDDTMEGKKDLLIKVLEEITDSDEEKLGDISTTNVSSEEIKIQMKKNMVTSLLKIYHQSVVASSNVYVYNANIFSSLAGIPNKEQMTKWKRAKVKIAVAGQSAAGKSAFINAIRGVVFSEDGYAIEGFGDTTMKIEEYVHPKNKQIVYCDLPGYGTTTITRETFLEKVTISDFDMFIIFSRRYLQLMMIGWSDGYKKLIYRSVL